MELHFYTNLETIKGIQRGSEMYVVTKEGRVLGDDIHVSFDTKYYRISPVKDVLHTFKVKKSIFENPCL